MVTGMLSASSTLCWAVIMFGVIVSMTSIIWFTGLRAEFETGCVQYNVPKPLVSTIIKTIENRFRIICCKICWHVFKEYVCKPAHCVYKPVHGVWYGCCYWIKHCMRHVMGFCDLMTFLTWSKIVWFPMDFGHDVFHFVLHCKWYWIRHVIPICGHFGVWGGIPASSVISLKTTFYKESFSTGHWPSGYAGI